TASSSRRATTPAPSTLRPPRSAAGSCVTSDALGPSRSASGSTGNANASSRATSRPRCARCTATAWRCRPGSPRSSASSGDSTPTSPSRRRADMPSYDKSVIEDLIDGTLPWPTTKHMMSSYKDEGRFTTYLEILQERVPWQERILLPLGEHLYI